MLSGTIVSSISPAVVKDVPSSTQINARNALENSEQELKTDEKVMQLKNRDRTQSFSESVCRQYENFFKYCCICLVRRRKSISSHDDNNGWSVGDSNAVESSSMVNTIYKIDYDSNSTSILPVISYHMVKTINGRTGSNNVLHNNT